MDKYFDAYETPLKYHKFLKYVGLPLSILTSLSKLLSTIADMNGAYGIVKDAYTLDVVFQIALLVVGAITIYGFYTWKPCGFYGIIASYIVSIVYSLLAIAFFAQYAPGIIAECVGQIIGLVIVAVPVGIYYLKRRPLFFPEMREWYLKKKFAPVPVTPQPVTPQMADKSGGDPTRCRCCGEKLNTGRTVCMKCGTAVPELSVEEKPAENAQLHQDNERPCYCSRCGNKLEIDSNFCNRCGAKV